MGRTRRLLGAGAVVLVLALVSFSVLNRVVMLFGGAAGSSFFHTSSGIRVASDVIAPTSTTHDDPISPAGSPQFVSSNPSARSSAIGPTPSPNIALVSYGDTISSTDPLISVHLDGWAVSEYGVANITARWVPQSTPAWDCDTRSTSVQIALHYSGTATAGVDFIATDVLNLPAGARRASIGVLMVDDGTVEPYETILLGVRVTNVTGGCKKVAVRVTGAALIVDNDRPPCELSQDAVGEWITPRPEWRIPRFDWLNLPGVHISHNPYCVTDAEIRHRGQAPDEVHTAIFEPYECSLSWMTKGEMLQTVTNRTLFMVGDSVTFQHAAILSQILLESRNGNQQYGGLFGRRIPCLGSPRCYKDTTFTCAGTDGPPWFRVCFCEIDCDLFIGAGTFLQLVLNETKWARSFMPTVEGQRAVWLVNFGLHKERIVDVDIFIDALRDIKARAGARLPHIWFRETSPQHFPSSEGFWAQRWSSDRCLPLNDSRRTWSLQNNATTTAMRNTGIPVMYIWNSTAPRYMDHYGHTWLPGSQDRSLLDCTHYCLGSAVYRHWTRLLLHFVRRIDDGDPASAGPLPGL